MEKVFEHSNHKRLWMWLAEHPEKHKNDWTEWKYNGGSLEEIDADCFACEYTNDCDLCPLVWEPINPSCTCGLFFKWDESTDMEDRSRLALMIANLPVKGEVKCI